jgi:hypothetical protein
VPRLHEHNAAERHEGRAAAAHLGRKQGPPVFGQSGAEQAAPAPEDARGGAQSPGLGRPASGAALAGRALHSSGARRAARSRVGQAG